MADFIDRALATSHPFANGRYDHENANEHFILGHESYREWLEDLPSADVVPWSFLERYADWFCALVPYPEFIREAKQFYMGSVGAMEGGGIDG